MKLEKLAELRRVNLELKSNVSKIKNSILLLD